jgi:hypothetical protein
MRTGRFAWVLALLLCDGCSLALDWDMNLLPCDRQRECLEGYSCLGSVCVADKSITADDTCSLDQQCEGDLVCSPRPHFACRTPCNAFYEPTGDCGAGEYCRPYDSGGSSIDPRGACVLSDCTTNTDCDPDQACVKITSSASACIKRCTITWNGDAYGDNCSLNPSTPEYCQPVGAQGEQKLVCLPTQNTAQVEGGLCSAVDEPCRRGLACVSLQCKIYCKPEEDGGDGEQCSGSQNCITKSQNSPRYGVCE